MKTYCNPEIKQQFIESAKPVTDVYRLYVDYNNVRLIEIPYPTDVIPKVFDGIQLECEIRDGDYHGVDVVVYQITDGRATDHYLFYEYNYGSCSECDYYSSTLCKLCYIPDHEINDAINKCETFIVGIINSIKLVERLRIKEFILDNYGHMWEHNDESPMLKLVEHFNI